LSGEPLSDEQSLLLNHLPSSTPANWDPEIVVLVPRNINLERVCALGKAAYQHDRQVNPASLDWEFALAVFTLDRHPMGGLLQWAGMKVRRPRWDGLLLVVTASLPIVAVVLLVWNADGPWFQSVGIGSGCVATMLLMFFTSRRIKKQRLEEDIERCRLASRFVGTVPR
jgi:methylase of polypeptide subunit release factors